MLGADNTRDSVRAMSRPTVLLVDDEPALLTATSRLLQRVGFDTVECGDGVSALSVLRGGRPVHVVISDVCMPQMDGIDLLRAVRQLDLDLPVIVVTGGPTLETAIEALDHGAFKYLVKPVDFEELCRATHRAVQLYMLSRAKMEAFEALGHFKGNNSDPLGLQTAFDSALDSLWPAFQPIVSAQDGSLFAYEALLRTEEPSLPHPGAVLDAAERLNQLHLLGRTMRLKATTEFGATLPPLELFLNLHPQDLHDDELLEATSATLPHASRIVLEVTERATLPRAGDVRGRVSALREAGYRIAIDDLGAGYAGLSTFATLEPEFVKLDMELIRNLHEVPVKQRLVKHMTALCHDMGMRVVAEGIETEIERDTVAALGCDLLQGYLFGHPAAGFERPTW